MDRDQDLRQHLVSMLRGGHAHALFAEAVSGWPESFRGARHPGAAHTPWQLLEHLRIAQWDILEFSRDARHVSPDFPSGYWPGEDAPPDETAWDRSVAAFEDDSRAMQRLILDPAVNLYAKIPHGDGQTLLREALTVAAHNSYHIGQLMMLRKLLGV